MSKINILDKSVYNKIAAGEVVEKPASVVKELVENSIDAGATNISIDILEGGISKIKVIDNGCGIEKDDFHKVFLAHATSKVKTIDDLNAIGTLGFRGEALSSIASVSKVTLISKTDEDIGYTLSVIGGELGEISPIGATKGTCMTIEDLFFNIPARKKFLRKSKMEENEITNLVARLILANPQVSIKYTADNKLIYQSFGTGLYDAIYAIYGKSIVGNIFDFSFKSGDFDFSGYLCKPTFSKSNRTYQTLIINGRYVINQTISTAIYKAYENFIMKGSFPFFVINLKIPLDKVDVNVHPNKLDVKFEDSNQIFGIVYSKVSEILYGVDNTKNIVTDDADTIVVDKSKLQTLDSGVGSQYVATKSNATSDVKEEFNKESVSEIELGLEKYASTEYSKDDNSVEESNSNLTSERLNDLCEKIKEVTVSDSKDVTVDGEGKLFNDEFKAFDFKVNSPVYKFGDYVGGGQLNSIDENKNHQQETIDDGQHNFKVIGTLFDTYILVEKDSSLLLIDQHAGHERILFDKFCKELEDKQVAIQPLLVPFVFETNIVESNFLNDNIGTLNQLGFEIDSFGENTYKISTVPMLLQNINIQGFIDNILHDIDNKLIISKSDTIRDYLAKSACKSAVKGKDVLTKNEIDVLLEKISNPSQVLLCPHGRPIVISVSEKEIEKWFKRIV